MKNNVRIEKDSMGEMEVPAEALYGASTQRAVLNFPISGTGLPAPFIHAYGLLKAYAAEVNGELGNIDADRAARISRAGKEVATGKYDEHFPVDIYQTGSGTSTNMNVNEVLAALANREESDVHKHVHQNDHVNYGQSSNDTFPTVLHLSTAVELKNKLAPALKRLGDALDAKAKEFEKVVKIGRTHLMDATPMTLGQEFSAWTQQVRHAEKRCAAALEALLELALGGTAVGTGLNTHPEFSQKTIAKLAEHYGIPFREAENHFEAQSARDAAVEAHGQLKTIAVSLHKIACDIRLLASGPRCAFGEISQPATQPGSSIMPGKVNPVMSEALTMVAARVAGNDTTMGWCGIGGFLELNVSMPLMAAALHESITLLAAGADAFREKAVEGITANEDICAGFIEKSLSMVTSLAPVIGYDRASSIAQEALQSGKTVRALCHEQAEELGESIEEIDAALNPAKMAGL